MKIMIALTHLTAIKDEMMLRRAKKSYFKFQLRISQPVGCKVTSCKMYEFLLEVNVAVPLSVTFGVSKAFDK